MLASIDINQLSESQLHELAAQMQDALGERDETIRHCRLRNVTTHGYVEADMAMKERSLATITSPATQHKRYRPTDTLLQFPESL